MTMTMKFSTDVKLNMEQQNQKETDINRQFSKLQTRT